MIGANIHPNLPEAPMISPQSSDELAFISAAELVHRIRTRDLSASEVLSATLARIERVNPQVNAICTLVPERAREEAAAADRALARGKPIGSLHGLPIAVKDLVDTAGIRTTYGSPIYRDHVPVQDALLVERLRRAGAIIIGKTNVPEFGAGSHTFNPVFGPTRNPYDLGRSAGGSSGGAAAALASGMVALADGSDLGGSLRNPGSFNNVVGFRPSPGRVPSWPAQLAWFSLGVEGPMARTVSDAALLLSVLAGPDPRDPLSLPEPGAAFSVPLERDLTGVRVAWTPDLGRYPVDPQVVDVCRRAVDALAGLGCRVEEAAPDLTGVDEVFQVLRAWKMAHSRRADYENHRDRLKETVVWNVEQGLRLSGPDVAAAEEGRTTIYHRVRRFMERYEYLVLPVSQVPPFPIELDWVHEINGVPMETYIDWMATCYAITVTELPAISVPAGFTPTGLPVGLQIVGRRHQDLAVLQLAHAFEVATGYGRRRPPAFAVP
jgi:amidase